METKISSYQETGIRLQLLAIDTDDTHFNQYQIPVGGRRYYQIRKNRKILCNFKWITPAKQKFLRLIQDELLQTSINYEKEQ